MLDKQIRDIAYLIQYRTMYCGEHLHDFKGDKFIELLCYIHKGQQYLVAPYVSCA